MAAYIKFDGVDGEAQDKDHKAWNDLLSFGQVIHKIGGGATSTARRRGDTQFEDIQISKLLDKSSPKLAEALAKGRVFPKVEIPTTASYTDSGRVTYYAYELKDVMVSSYSVSGGSEDKPTESMSLNFEEIKVTYTRNATTRARRRATSNTNGKSPKTNSSGPAAMTNRQGKGREIESYPFSVLRRPIISDWRCVSFFFARGGTTMETPPPRAASTLRILLLLLVGFSLLHKGCAAAAASDRELVITDCSMFDPESNRMLSRRTILIRGERIVSVCEAGQAIDIPATAMRIDGRTRFVIPGLIDAHVHLVHISDFANLTGDELLPLFLAAGVTSVRSTGDEIVAATLVARVAERQPAISPRVFTCSPLLDADPPIHRDIGKGLTDPSQVPPLLDDLSRWQVSTLKIYAGTSRPIGKSIIEEGHRRGMLVTAHLGAYSAQDAVADGIDCLEHIWSVFNYVIPPEVAREPGIRGRVDLENPLCRSLVEELARRKVFVDPTLAVFRNMILLPDVPSVREHPDNQLAPRRLREFWPIYLTRTGCPQGGPLEDRRREFGKFQELVGRMSRAGVLLLAGTDTPEPQCTPGFSLHQELEMLVESGLSPAEAIRAATLHNAMALRQQDHLGSIAPGKLADLVLLDADPLADIRNTRRIELVIRGGIPARPAELLKQVPTN